MSQPPCPKCQTPMQFDDREARYTCPQCGHARYETLDEAQARMRPQLEAMNRAPGQLRMTDRSQVSARALIHYEDGQAARMRGEIDEALRAFEKAIDLDSDLVDAHYWIAQLTDDEALKREHLSLILAHEPGNLDALRALMVLDGRLTPEEAARTHDSGGVPMTHVAAPIQAVTETLICPVCGGALTADESTGAVSCKFCGYAEVPQPTSDPMGESFGVAMLERRAQGVQWQIGGRIIHCNQCGAERTIPARELSMVCAFCGSTHVIETDALQSFIAPDGLIPFHISETQAQSAIRDALKGIGERLTSVFDDNKIARAGLIGMYLPFWVYDIMVTVSVTTLDTRMRREDVMRRVRSPYQNHQFQDAMLGVAVPGVKSPGRALLERIGDYDLSNIRPYQPELLARYPARLYDYDFERGALDAREEVAKVMRARYGRDGSPNVDTTVSTMPRSISFMLLLLPVWVATLYERDGDVRPALVNGQTGLCALGRAGSAVEE